MERMVKLGLTKSIGVSNCQLTMLLDIFTYAKIKPVTNQIEVHPYFVRKELVDFHKKLNVTITAFGPLSAPNYDYLRELVGIGKTSPLDDPIIKDLAKKYSKSPA